MTIHKHSRSGLKTLVVLLVASPLLIGRGAVVANAAAKTAKSSYTEAQKKELRKWGLEWCRKKFIQGGAFIVRVEIMDHNRVRCWYKS